MARFFIKFNKTLYTFQLEISPSSTAGDLLSAFQTAQNLFHDHKLSLFFQFSNQDAEFLSLSESTLLSGMVSVGIGSQENPFKLKAINTNIQIKKRLIGSLLVNDDVIEGVDPHGQSTVNRSQKVNEICDLLEYRNVLLIKSPPMTGKTSMASLIASHIYDLAVGDVLISNYHCYSLKGSAANGSLKKHSILCLKRIILHGRRYIHYGPKSISL